MAPNGTFFVIRPGGRPALAKITHRSQNRYFMITKINDYTSIETHCDNSVTIQQIHSAGTSWVVFNRDEFMNALRLIADRVETTETDLKPSTTHP